MTAAGVPAPRGLGGTDSPGPRRQLFIGLMSGTSLDGVDGVLAEFREDTAADHAAEAAAAAAAASGAGEGRDAQAPGGAGHGPGLSAAAPLDDGPGAHMSVLRAVHLPMPLELQHMFLALQASGPDELHREALAGMQLARLYAACAHQLLAPAADITDSRVKEASATGSAARGAGDARASGSAAVAAADVTAIGAHGQTIRHQPAEGYTRQSLDAALLAELTCIDVVADLRARDVAAGGQGAPLVPRFHRALFLARETVPGSGGDDAPDEPGVSGMPRAPGAPARRSASGRGLEPAGPRIIVNLGGIANISVLSADPRGPLVGHDTGPGNCLLDAWAEEHLHTSYDASGAWGAGGVVNAPLLEAMRREPYFAKPPPKSTGRDLFNRSWLNRCLADAALTVAAAAAGSDSSSGEVARRADGPGSAGASVAESPPTTISPRDVMATLAELTSSTVAAAIVPHCGRGSNADVSVALRSGSGPPDEAGAGGPASAGNPPPSALVVLCGGGAHNAAVAARLSALLRPHGARVITSLETEARIPVESVEALAFAWLAHRHVRRRAGNWPAVTGAEGPRVLGALYPR